jgi:hypothetical protein
MKATQTKKSVITPEKEKKTHYTIRIKPTLLGKLRVRADKEFRNTNNLIEYLLEQSV